MWWGITMTERRKATRFELSMPLQVCLPGVHPPEYHAAQIRDLSRQGIYFYSQSAIEPGREVEVTFSLPADRSRGANVLVRASGRAVRVASLTGKVTPTYGVAAVFDRIDFVRPEMSTAA